mgnify:CR=1 FL=1
MNEEGFGLSMEDKVMLDKKEKNSIVYDKNFIQMKLPVQRKLTIIYEELTIDKWTLSTI